MIERKNYGSISASLIIHFVQARKQPWPEIVTWNGGGFYPIRNPGWWNVLDKTTPIKNSSWIGHLFRSLCPLPLLFPSFDTIHQKHFATLSSILPMIQATQRFQFSEQVVLIVYQWCSDCHRQDDSEVASMQCKHQFHRSCISRRGFQVVEQC